MTPLTLNFKTLSAIFLPNTKGKWNNCEDQDSESLNGRIQIRPKNDSDPQHWCPDLVMQKEAQEKSKQYNTFGYLCPTKFIKEKTYETKNVVY